jgi:hypothetical protein
MQQQPTRDEFTAAQIRKFLTVLFATRAKRHLKTLADLYGWSPETLAANEARFIRISDCVPRFATAAEWHRARLPEIEEEADTV